MKYISEAMHNFIFLFVDNSLDNSHSPSWSYNGPIIIFELGNLFKTLNIFFQNHQIGQYNNLQIYNY